MEWIEADFYLELKYHNQIVAFSVVHLRDQLKERTPKALKYLALSEKSEKNFVIYTNFQKEISQKLEGEIFLFWY